MVSTGQWAWARITWPSSPLLTHANDDFQAYLERQAQSMLGTSSEQIVSALGDAVGGVDRKALSGSLGEFKFMVRELAHSLSNRVWGCFDGDRAILGAWSGWPGTSEPMLI